jgi:hypothetical protein
MFRRAALISIIGMSTIIRMGITDEVRAVALT